MKQQRPRIEENVEQKNDKDVVVSLFSGLPLRASSATMKYTPKRSLQSLYDCDYLRSD
jgi:hypothetical protein